MRNVVARHAWDRAAIEDGRLLIVSLVSQSILRADAQSAAVRNRFVLEHSEHHVFGSLDSNGQLAKILEGLLQGQIQILG